ncbi:MAG: hypothetical protein ABR506_05020 [Candidatus Krumholzibacteriia bacterium]
MPRCSPSVAPFLFVLLLAPAAVAQSYWAVENGAVLRYGDRLITVVGGGGSVCYTMESAPGYGTSDCYNLGDYATPPDHEELWLLHPQLGRVEGLLSWEGIVPNEAAAWGGVKALYR